MTVLVCGSREWGDWDAMLRHIRTLPEGSTVLHGGCRGADQMAARMARNLRLCVREFAAEWDAHGKAAGPLRNQRMLDEGRPDEVWAFTLNLATSKGTKDMVTRARAAGVPVRVLP